jgi:ribonucleotide reductase beta subunit family protein with ferritin-like domain
MTPHAGNHSTRPKVSRSIEAMSGTGDRMTRDELIHLATKRRLYNDERMAELESITSKLQKQMKSKKQVKEEIEWAKAGTRKAVAAMLKQ